MALIEDLSALLPVAIREPSQQLKISWQENAQLLGKNVQAEKDLAQSIAATRAATRKLLISLN